MAHTLWEWLRTASRHEYEYAAQDGGITYDVRSPVLMLYIMSIRTMESVL